MAGWQPLPATEWLAWQRITGNLVSPEEWEMLREMDGAFVVAAADLSQGEKSARQSELPELTVAAFDAVFG